MTKHPEIYYVIDEPSRTIFWTEDESALEDRPDLVFIGSSTNPNKRMAVAVFVQNDDQDFGYKIKQLP